MIRSVAPGLLLLLTLACQGQAAPTGKQGGAPAPAAVVTTTVEGESLVVERAFLGEVQADSDAALSAAEPSRVKRVLVQEGDRVAAGDLLIELDDRLARAELGAAVADRQQAEIERSHAERQAERYRALESEQVVSVLEASREIDEAARLAAREQGVSAAVKVRGERLYRHRVVAPFDGVVARRLVDPGDWLAAGQPALQLLSAGSVEVLVRVPENLLDQLGGLVNVELVSKGERVPGELRGVVQALDPATRTALLRVEPQRRPEWLRAGKSIDVAFFVEQRGGWLVPRDALVQTVAGLRVMKVVDGKVQPVPVTLVATMGEQALVQGELRKGDTIVTKGNERLRPGQAVTTERAFGAERARNAEPATSTRAPEQVP